MHDLETLLQDYLQHLRDLNSSPHTVERIRSGVSLFLVWLEDACEVRRACDLRSDYLHRYQRHFGQYTTKKGLPLKPSSVNSRIKSLRSFLDFLHDRRYIVAKLSREIEYIKEDRLLPVSILTHAQVRKLLRRINTDTEPGIRDRAAVELLYSNGVRISELEALDLQDVDLGTASMKVIGKGRKERFLPIGKTALKWLNSYIRAPGHSSSRAMGSGPCSSTAEAGDGTRAASVSSSVATPPWPASSSRSRPTPFAAAAPPR